MLPALEFGLPASAQEFRKGQIQTALYLVVPQAPTNERGRKERGREKGRRDEEKRRGVEKCSFLLEKTHELKQRIGNLCSSPPVSLLPFVLSRTLLALSPPPVPPPHPSISPSLFPTHTHKLLLSHTSTVTLSHSTPHSLSCCNLPELRLRASLT